jgi:hypothetical protein
MFEVNADNQFVFDLQLFAEDPLEGAGTPPAAPSEGGETSPAPAQPAGGQSLSEFLESRLTGNEPPNGGQAPIVEPQTVPAGGEQLTEPGPLPLTGVENIPDKFRNADGSLNSAALLNSYRNMEDVLGRQGNKLGQMGALESENQRLQSIISGIMAGQLAAAQPVLPQGAGPEQPPPAAANPYELTPELRAKLEEEFYDDPIGLQMKLIELTVPKAVNPELSKINPIIEQYERTEALNRKAEELTRQMQDFAAATPDFFEYQEAMGQIADQYPQLQDVPNSVEIIYNMAKAQAPPLPPVTPPERGQAHDKGPNLEQMLQDQEVLKALAANEELKNMIIQQQIQGIKDNPAPPVAGMGTAGLPPATNPVDLKDKKTAIQALKAKYAGFSFS